MKHIEEPTWQEGLLANSNEDQSPFPTSHEKLDSVNHQVILEANPFPVEPWVNYGPADWHLIAACERHRGREPKQAVSELLTNRNQDNKYELF